MEVITIFDDVCIKNMRHAISAVCQQLLPPLEKSAKECCTPHIYQHLLLLSPVVYDI